MQKVIITRNFLPGNKGKKGKYLVVNYGDNPITDGKPVDEVSILDMKIEKSYNVPCAALFESFGCGVVMIGLLEEPQEIKFDFNGFINEAGIRVDTAKRVTLSPHGLFAVR